MPIDTRSVAPSRGWHALALVATLAAWALLAVVIAYWLWQLLAPPRVHIPPAGPADPGSALLASGLFSRGAPPVQSAEAPAALPGDARLLGVFAEADDRGYALFRLSSGPKLVAVGQEIAPGATLAAVRPDGIVVREAVGERSIGLRNAQPKTVPAATAKQEKTSASASRAACSPPSGFKGQIVALNAELMNGLIAQPDSWRALLEPSTAALLVRDESGFAAMLGLKRGDRIEQANGIALVSADDVISAVLRPLASNQPVRLTGSREGQPRELWLRNTAC